VPVVVGAAILGTELVHGGHSARASPILLGLAAAASLFARHRWPGWTLACSGALGAVLVHVDHSVGAVAILAPAVALYTLALSRGRRAQVIGGLVAVAAVLVADLEHSGQPGLAQTAGHVLLVAIPLLAAEAIRNHRANLRLLTERLELAEHAREQEAARRVEQERMRIARELHDVVAHTLTEINVQAAAAAERTQPREPHAALERIERASHDAMRELRAILGVLRDENGADPPRAPAPGISDLAQLTDRARAAGLDIQVDVSGEQPAHLSDAASLAAYRIVQESLTNARRHAPGAPVRIELRFNHDELSVAIETEPGAGSNGNDAGPGVGITGLRERAAAIGGTLKAGPTPNGFMVQARLPYQPAG